MSDHFPTNPPPQMPCPHWNHFPINPQKPPKFGASSGLNGNTGASPPPSPDSYAYCTACNAERKPKKMATQQRQVNNNKTAV